MRLRRLAPVFFCLLLAPTMQAHATETPAEHAANQYAAAELKSAPPAGNLPDYSLSAEQLAKAQHLETVRVVTNFGGTLWNVLQYVLLLWLGIAAWIQDRATSTSAALRERGKRGRAFWRECVIFTVLLTVLTSLLDLPLSLYQHHLGLKYGLSIQSWLSWFGDWGKSSSSAWLGASCFLPC